MINKRILPGIIAIFLVSMLAIVLPVVSTDSGANTGNITSVISNSSTSHASSETSPDYETVFPDDEIREIYITISSDSWEEMQDDMESKFGEFGNTTMPGQGGMGGPGGDMTDGNRTLGEGEMRPQGGPSQVSNSDPIYVLANVSCNGETWNHIGLRYKGFNSLMTAWQQGIGKISLKLDMDHYEDEYPETKTQKFYGFKELNLQSGLSDKTVIREKITPEVFNDSGVPAPETAFYKVYLDHGDGSEYYGLYTLVEAVDDTVIETQFSNGNGNLYKPEGEGATFGEGKLNLTNFEKKTNENEADYSDIETLYNTLHSGTRTTSPETWRSDLESIFDVDEFLTWLATNTLIKNFDTYGGNSRNYYLYNNPDSGTFSWIPWDNNYAFMDGMPGMGEGSGPMGPGGMNSNGPFGMNIPPDGVNMTMAGRDGGAGPMGPGGMGSSVSFSMENVTDQWPLIRYLMDDPIYHEKYVETLRQIAETSFNPTALEEKINTYHDLIESSVIELDGEREGFTYLTNESDFDEACEEMKAHIRSQYDKAMEYLSSEGVV